MATTTTTTTTTPTEPDDDLHVIAAEQRCELMAAQVLESDLDLAFQLQIQEAITASLSLQPSSASASASTSAPPPQLITNDDEDKVFNFSSLQTEELEKFERECRDRIITEAEMKKAKIDLFRRIHDYKVASEIELMPDDEWEEFGENFERPFGEGSSKEGANVAASETFRVYFKGLVSEERVSGSNVSLAGIGVAICDSRDELIFELRKPLIGNGKNRQAAEAKALIEGLNSAIALDLKRIVFFCDCYPLYQFVIGRWPPKQRKIATLVSQVTLLRKKFVYSAPSLVARNDMKFAFKLAREAIVSQVNRSSESSSAKNMHETCVICLEDVDVGQMFAVAGCLHRYCFSCMKQHVEVKLLHGMLPKCPHEGCNSELKIESCRKFLTRKLIEIMNQRIKEASIPATEKIYCPYPKCSALMSKSEVLEYSKLTLLGVQQSGVRKCTKCQGLFCINCKVPWHAKKSCLDYKRENPFPPVEDAKLKTLADRNLWRQCVKCNHMIELAAGCYHMTCRCGFEFCYTCGAEWKNKAATCSCPLWDEDNILYDDEDEDDDDEDDDEEEDYDDYYDTESDDYY
ncbi:putative E3 ubiquitin-protein ligase rbrA [Camellia lanceoleosa]|uniref:E3 ubiquitin-protein ligase rbrA n=1 Tax=Camellia lanceoleosa TaxID=1840588 RepID=A0ACC0HRT3_9ERIC|nr:putative E3 ubiquitin-protein ligase rbrA [Camellia lanceoleosa]